LTGRAGRSGRPTTGEGRLRTLRHVFGPRRLVDLAQATGLSVGTLSMVERAVGGASSETLNAIADALGLDPGAVLRAYQDDRREGICPQKKTSAYRKRKRASRRKSRAQRSRKRRPPPGP
jgi:transcriptional regulator with XRE-family HTH domain